MNALIAVSRAIDRLTAFVGKSVAWLILASVLVSAVNAIVRKTFDMSSNAWLELQWYLFGAVFMLAAAWTLQKNEHVRVDIVSGFFSARVRNWIDLLGHLLVLVPFTLLMLKLLVPYVIHSFEIQEYSPNAGGLILWPAKALLLGGFLLLFLQAVSEIIKRASILFFGMEDTTPLNSNHPSMEDVAVAPGPDDVAPASGDEGERR